MTLNGRLSINGSLGMFLYGINVSGSPSDGITITNSSQIELNTCSSNNNAGQGVHVDFGSAVLFEASGVYDNNGSYGIFVGGESLLTFNGWAGVIDISNNFDAGLYAERATVYADALNITNNKVNPNTPGDGGYGIDFRGGASGVFFGVFSFNTISGNQSAGVSLQENSQISFCCGHLPGTPLSNIIDGNGPVGLSIGFGSQATIADGVQITNHADTGVDVFGNSQAYIVGTTQISNNGSSASYPARAGVRVDGTSEAYVRDAVISHNGGPGILAIVNSSIDVGGVTFTGNDDDPVQCDSSSYLASDLPSAHGPHGAASSCKVPTTLPSRDHRRPLPHIPNLRANKAREDAYRKITPQHP
jgi:hypothetical protein